MQAPIQINLSAAISTDETWEEHCAKVSSAWRRLGSGCNAHVYAIEDEPDAVIKVGTAGRDPELDGYLHYIRHFNNNNPHKPQLYEFTLYRSDDNKFWYVLKMERLVHQSSVEDFEEIIEAHFGVDQAEYIAADSLAKPQTKAAAEVVKFIQTAVDTDIFGDDMMDFNMMWRRVGRNEYFPVVTDPLHNMHDSSGNYLESSDYVDSDGE